MITYACVLDYVGKPTLVSFTHVVGWSIGHTSYARRKELRYLWKTVKALNIFWNANQETSIINLPLNTNLVAFSMPSNTLALKDLIHLLKNAWNALILAAWGILTSTKLNASADAVNHNLKDHELDQPLPTIYISQPEFLIQLMEAYKENDFNILDHVLHAVLASSYFAIVHIKDGRIHGFLIDVLRLRIFCESGFNDGNLLEALNWWLSEHLEASAIKALEPMELRTPEFGDGSCGLASLAAIEDHFCRLTGATPPKWLYSEESFRHHFLTRIIGEFAQDYNNKMSEDEVRLCFQLPVHVWITNSNSFRALQDHTKPHRQKIQLCQHL